MSIASGSKEGATEQAEISVNGTKPVHSYCSNSPKNIPDITILCCGSRPVGEKAPDDAPISCPMCADIEDEYTQTCACWW
jgi:hypothetical protein